MIAIAVAAGVFSGYAGLVLSFHAGIPSGPAVILVAGVLYALSLAVRSCRRPGRASCLPGVILKRERSEEGDHTGKTFSHCGCNDRGAALRRPRQRAGQDQGRRDLFDPCAISSRMSAASASRSRALSVPTATRMSMRRRRPTRKRWPTPRSSLSTASASRAGSTGWSRRPARKAAEAVASKASSRASMEEDGRRQDRSACLAVGRERQDLCRQYPRCADRRRRRRTRPSTRRTPPPISANSMRSRRR